MAARHTTMRGEPIDMAALAAQHASRPALGNAKMNARGDILGEGGIVLKTQEQIEAEWAAEKAKQSLTSGKRANLKSPLPDVVDANSPKMLENQTDDLMSADISEMPQVTDTKKPQRRKITDAA